MMFFVVEIYILCWKWLNHLILGDPDWPKNFPILGYVHIGLF